MYIQDVVQIREKPRASNAHTFLKLLLPCREVLVLDPGMFCFELDPPRLRLANSRILFGSYLNGGFIICADWGSISCSG